MPDSFHLAIPARPVVEKASYRDAMSSIAATACLVTASDGVRRLGRTITSVFSLSVEPPAILVSIDQTSELATMIAQAGSFSFAMFAQDQQHIADAFAGRHAPERRFENGSWQMWQSGHPRLEGAASAMDCQVTGAVETGTHILFAGAVVDVVMNPHVKPLIWHQRAYKTVADAAYMNAAIQ